MTMIGATALPVPLRKPHINRGTAYTQDERRHLGIEGLLPPRVETLQEQASRVVENVRQKATALEKYRFLSTIQCENETLFYRVVVDHLDEMLPLVYTPTVGEACLNWSRIYERPRGLYISAAQHRGRIAQVLRNWPHPGVKLIVVTDGGRILGLGDLGAHGMGIPIGKLSLYTSCAGIAPDLCLPVVLDVGTDNESVRSDGWYLGERHPRLTGAPYDAFLDEFVAATQAVFPGAILQFEDFNNRCAFQLLARYRNQLCCFNDDIQGTGAMGLAGLYSAARITGRPLREQRILFVGAGEACLGIGHLVTTAMRRDGLSEAEVRDRCLFVDSKGVLTVRRGDLPDHKRPFAHDREPQLDLLKAIRDFRPSVLIGACAQPGIFTQPVLQTMAQLNEKPVVFALSNPTSRAECTAEQAYTWTNGHAVFASGSPFAPVKVANRLHVPGQGNNFLIFPGVGLGLLVSGARRVTDEMFMAAARALASRVSERDLQEGRVFPAASYMREVALAVSVATATVAYDEGHAIQPRPADLRAAAVRTMFAPGYE
jgi:malate dehydrogenase (oxaloacetate-decarboxylating)(NADP+)